MSAEPVRPEPIIMLKHVTKAYQLYDRPIDRLKEGLSITHKSYHRTHTVLDDFNLTVLRGESVGFVGRNGAGKSTLLKLITGVLTANSGTIEVKGKVAALLELGAGFNMEYTGRQNIYLNGKMMGYSKEQMDERADSIIEFADIGEFIDQPVRTYSSGMFARLAFAVSINVSPDILIVDEVLSVGDTRFQMKCIDKMKELKDRGTTVLFVSHTLEQIKRFCSRAVWMRDGHIEMEGEASEIIDLYDSHMRTGMDIETLKALKAGVQKETGTTGEASQEDKVLTIDSVRLNQTSFHTFDSLEVTIGYTVNTDHVEGFSFGVAIYSEDRKLYVFGPNTYLEKVDVPCTEGHHIVIYRVPRLPLIQGIYSVDVGIFSNGGLVNLDYKNDIKKFVVSNSYFTEGTCYMDHEWQVVS